MHAASGLGVSLGPARSSVTSGYKHQWQGNDAAARSHRRSCPNVGITNEDNGDLLDVAGDVPSRRLSSSPQIFVPAWAGSAPSFDARWRRAGRQCEKSLPWAGEFNLSLRLYIG